MIQKITGYRELTPAEVECINQIKAKAEEVRVLVEDALSDPATDKRWASIGKTHLQEGFMALVRSIAQPETF